MKYIWKHEQKLIRYTKISAETNHKLFGAVYGCFYSGRIALWHSLEVTSPYPPHLPAAFYVAKKLPPAMNFRHIRRDFLIQTLQTPPNFTVSCGSKFEREQTKRCVENFCLVSQKPWIRTGIRRLENKFAPEFCIRTYRDGSETPFRQRPHCLLRYPSRGAR